MIPTQTYETVFNKFISAVKWMKSIGVKISLGRTTSYENIIGLYKDSYKSLSANEIEGIFPGFVSSIFEVHDFIGIHESFMEISPDQLTGLVNKLQKAVNGPVNSIDETHVSTASRNFLFEAVVAAKSHHPDKGINAILDAHSDSGIRIGGKKIWVECKRVTTLKQIKKNIQKASKQLEITFNKKIGSGHRGVVAVDISKILQAGDKIFVRENDSSLINSVDYLMDKFINDYSHIWQDILSRRDRKIIGVIIRFSFMSSSEDRNLLVYTSQWGLNPRLGNSESDNCILKSLTSAIK